jgi:hypothetical protein
MAYKLYKCKVCGHCVYSFPEDLPKKNTKCNVNGHLYEEQSNYPVVVHATNSFMSTELMLDSAWTIHELDRILNIETAEEKQIKFLNDYRISN